MTKAVRTLSIRVDPEIWRLLDEYSNHLGRLKGEEQGPASDKLVGAILSYFFLALGEKLFEDMPTTNKEQLLERYKHLLSPVESPFSLIVGAGSSPETT